MPRPLALLLFTTCLLFAAAASARADTIILTGGFMTGDAIGADNNARGGFSGPGVSISTGESCCFSSNLNGRPLTPGQTLTVFTRFTTGSLGPFGEATVNGVTYQNVRVSVNLTAAPVELTVPAQVGSVMVPFSQITGTVTVRDAQFNVLFTGAVDGSGTGTYVFGRFGSDMLLTRAVSYRFTNTAVPTPEPATMLLLGTGLVGVVGAARRRRRITSS